MTQSLPEEWKRVLSSTDFFADLEPTALDQLGGEFEEIDVAPGDNLVRQGDPGDSLFVVLDGRLEVILEQDENLHLHDLGPGSVVGEIALVLGGERSATVRALEATRVLKLSRSKFDHLLDKTPAIMAPFSHALQQRMRRLRIAGYLRSIFGELDADALNEVEANMTWVHRDSGQELFQQGDAADGAYIVAVGRLRVVVADPVAGERIIDEVGPGQWIGEMALLTQKARSATVYAVRDSELVWLSQASFESLISKHPQAMLATSRLLVTRLQRQIGSERRQSVGARTFAIVPTGPNVAVTEFCEQLVAALARHGSVLYLTADIVDRHLDKPGIAAISHDHPAHLRLTPWLIEQENNYRYVVYEAEPNWSTWNDRTIRYADHILIVTDDQSDPGLSTNETLMETRFGTVRAPKRSLILLHDSQQPRFPRTMRWLETRQISDHFHVRRKSVADVARLARILTGKAICVVLGGGGSRGFSHVGVIRAFEELGIPIDVIAGTSIGSVIAGSYAMGLSSAELVGELSPIFNAFLDPTLPVVSLASARNLVRGAEGVAGPWQIEDLAIPYFSVSTNLTRGQEMVHRRGSLSFVARASGSIPGIFPPVPWNGDLLVDGGLSNNVPVDTMASLFQGAIVAVDVIPDVDLIADEHLPTHLSGWRVAWQSLNPFAKRVGMPNILSILMRSVTTASHSLRRANQAADLASLYLRPAVDQWNLIDFKAAPSIAQQGYKASFQDIKKWWERMQADLMGTPDNARQSE